MVVSIGAGDHAGVASTSIAAERQGSHTEDVCAIGKHMKVGIGSFGAWMLGVVGIIGSMAWLFHSYMIARAGALCATVAWLLGALTFIPMALILAELSSMFPTAGGPYVYKFYALKRLFKTSGEMLGFLTGWIFYASLLAGYACMANGLVNVTGGAAFGSLDKTPLWFGPAVIFALFAATTAVNLMHVGRATMLNNVFTVVKLLMVPAFVALVASAPSSSFKYLLNPANLSGHSNVLENLTSVLTMAIGGFGGIEIMACASSETRDARKNIPRAMFLTLGSVALIYAAMSAAIGVAAAYVLGPDKATSLVPGTKFSATFPGVVEFIAGNVWGRIAAGCVAASIIGCAIAGLLALARLGYSLASTGLFPRAFAQLDEGTKVPGYALKFQFIVLCVIGIAANLASRTGFFPDAYSYLGETFCFMYLFILLLYGVSLIILRYTDPDMARPYRIGARGNWQAWLVTLLATGIFGYVAFGCTKPIYQLGGLIILMSGLPVYGYFRWRRSVRR